MLSTWWEWVCKNQPRPSGGHAGLYPVGSEGRLKGFKLRKIYSDLLHYSILLVKNYLALYCWFFITLHVASKSLSLWSVNITIPTIWEWNLMLRDKSTLAKARRTRGSRFVTDCALSSFLMGSQWAFKHTPSSSNYFMSCSFSIRPYGLINQQSKMTGRGTGVGGQ